MDVYSLTKKQRPTHLTRGGQQTTTNSATMTSGQITTAAALANSSTKNLTSASASALAQLEQKHSQLPPQYRQALLEQEQQLQQQQAQQQRQLPSAPPTLAEIESKYSQLPPQYRQAVLEQQQREHQLRLQQPQNGTSTSPPRQQQQQQYHSVSLTSSPNGKGGGGNGNASRRGPASINSSHQRIVSAPLMSAHRADRQGTDSTQSSPGPSRAHWKPDSSTHVCTWPGCRREFGIFDRRHHCRRCGDIFCSAHCSKSVPLDQALDFNPVSGMLSRACNGCFEAYEQWQGLIPSPNPVRYQFQSVLQEQKNRNNGAISEGQLGSTANSLGEYNHNGGQSLVHKSSSGVLSNRKTMNTGHIPEGLLGSNSSGETLGREDIVRLPKTASETIAIKTRPVADPTNMPMPSVPHDWSWSTF